MVQGEDDTNGSLNTPKHYPSITTPKALRQYTTPPGVEQVGLTLLSQNRSSCFKLQELTATTRARNSPRKVKTPKYAEDSEESNDDIEDETYDEIVGVFQNKASSAHVVKKVDQSILDNMNVEISKDMSDQQFNAITKNAGPARGKKVTQETVSPMKTESVAEEEQEADDPSTDDDDMTEKGNVRIIRLGTEEVKKYAIINGRKTPWELDQQEFLNHSLRVSLKM